MSRAKKQRERFFWALTAVLLSIGCSAQTSSTSASSPRSRSTNKNSGQDGSVGGSSGAPSQASGQGGAGGNAWSQSDVAIGDAACQALSEEAKQIEVQVPTEVEVEVTTPNPVAIYIMLDKTGSMSEGGATKWVTAVTAINTFINDPNSQNIYVALQYFCTDNYANDCTGAVYATPAVPMGQLPDNAAAISASLAATGTGGRTPIEPALRGAIEYCKAFQQDPVNNPDKIKCVAVLVTDGEPNTCATDSTTLATIALDAYQNDQIMTFAVGMEGANFALLDQIAQAGNGDCTPDPADTTWACNVSTGGTTFIDALNNIRGVITTLKVETQMQTVMTAQKLDCQWSIPEPPSNQSFDKDKVNVQFSPTGDSKDSQTFGRVSSADKCGKLADAWYYDDPNKPTKIMACPDTCDAIKAAEKAKINILFGCETVIALQ